MQIKIIEVCTVFSYRRKPIDKFFLFLETCKHKRSLLRRLTEAAPQGEGTHLYKVINFILALIPLAGHEHEFVLQLS